MTLIRISRRFDESFARNLSVPIKFLSAMATPWDVGISGQDSSPGEGCGEIAISSESAICARKRQNRRSEGLRDSSQKRSAGESSVKVYSRSPAHQGQQQPPLSYPTAEGGEEEGVVTECRIVL